ncbi:hypothetical protein D3C77_666080 [compost metagenome]
MQGRVAVEPPTSVHQKLWCAAQYKTQAFSGTLQRIVEDAQNLFVIGVTGLGVCQFVQVDQFIQAYHQAAETSQAYES